MKIDFFPRAVRGGDVSSVWFDMEGQENVEELNVFVRIFAAPGGVTPTMVAIVEDTPDKDSADAPIGELGRTAVLNAVGVTPLRFDRFARFVRVRLDVEGTTPAFDCSVIADTD